MVLVDFNQTWAGRRAVVVMPLMPGEDPEIVPLIRTLDVSVDAVIRQRVPRPDTRFFVGAGKIGEVSSLADTMGLDTCIFSVDLKPSQIFNVQARTGLDVFDRSRVILQIFLQHASMKEAHLQVEYALLKYQVPMVRELINRSKTGEHPGFMAGGEYKVSEYYRLIRARMSRIKKALEKRRGSRGIRRGLRSGRGFYLVSLAGYTNAGKSSLLRALANCDALVDDRMFSTLGTTTRRIGRHVLLTDTVGFIEDLPPQLEEAFGSTLEEIVDSDLILLVLDMSDEPSEIARKVRVSLETIRGLKRKAGDQGKIPGIMLVLNKTDLVGDLGARARELESALGPEDARDIMSIHMTSAPERIGIRELRERLYGLVEERESIQGPEVGLTSPDPEAADPPAEPRR